MKEPLLSDDEFLASVRDARAERDALHVWWLGQSGFLLQCDGVHLLLDPYLSDSLTEKYAATDKPHVRMMRRVIAPERLDFIDVVTSSHNHTDHLDPETLQPLFAENPNLQIVAPQTNRIEVAVRAGIDPHDVVGVNDGKTVEAQGIRFTGIPAAHNTIERDAQGRCKYLGYVIEFGPWRIYHSGDTLVYDDLAEKVRAHGPIDLALLPINGDKPERRVAGNMNGAQAAALAKEIGAKIVVPCHYDMFEFNTASPDVFVNECERIGQAYCVLGVGDKLELKST
ncbi:MAG TPA: MBL fold metallo-hydrolase [Planctomycetota bacterium]|nr:MBL fold metallo-hydrolase [Planctomycetota bacterium]